MEQQPLTTKQKTKKAKKPRCCNRACNKRIKGLFSVDCKCGAVFCCNSHIFPAEAHNCNFDFVKENKKELEKRNVKCSFEKVVAI